MPDISLTVDYGPAGGRVYQGSGADIGVHKFDEPRQRMLVQMAADIAGIQAGREMKVLFYGIDDGPSGVIPDQILIAFVAMLCSWLRCGNDLIIGCVMGVSRSGYINIATMMLMTGWSYELCLAKIREARPQVNPMPCFVEQLKRLEPILTTGWDNEKTQVA